MAHTIFSTYFQIISGVILATFGIIISLVQIKFIPWNKYYFLISLLGAGLLILALTAMAVSIWYVSRVERYKIVKDIRQLG